MIRNLNIHQITYSQQLKKHNMKHLLIILAFGFSTALFSQSEAYYNKMRQTFQLMDSAKSTQDFQEVSATFERIGDAEKNQWIPYYYAALCQTRIGWLDQKIDKDKLADIAKGILAKADAISPGNSELFCLKSMVATQQMLIDPQNRYMSFGAESNQDLEKAKLADPSNPRPYYLEAASVFNTPVAFGGGKANAKPILEKALQLFKAFMPASPMHPNWGEKQTEDMLAQCQ